MAKCRQFATISSTVQYVLLDTHTDAECTVGGNPAKRIIWKAFYNPQVKFHLNDPLSSLESKEHHHCVENLIKQVSSMNWEKWDISSDFLPI